MPSNPGHREQLQPVLPYQRLGGAAGKTRRPHPPISGRHDAWMSKLYETGRFAEVSDLDLVTSRTDVARIVNEMLNDLRAHPTAWENSTLANFLEALSASLEGLPHLYTNRGESFPNQATWKVFAEALVMASGYE